ncbi:hypothetical protein P167DRAFT_384421 [Morchella conica CCBAS932]|uniref:Uncharacterized protein n=1 Tax=Morchella conica CCBAS932 TaxID=1392247 RepID=A0A3N4L3B4_9PEZI|nr:hypothetical protein P167DRAFT_384421 [Morchella conica CCBAS932]
MDLDLNRRIPCVGGGGVAYFNFAAALTLCIGGTGGTTDRQTDKQLGGGGGVGILANLNHWSFFRICRSIGSFYHVGTLS